MMFTLPEGAHIHITINPPTTHVAATPVLPVAMSRRPLLVGALGLALAFGAFETGRHGAVPNSASAKDGSLAGLRAPSLPVQPSATALEQYGPSEQAVPRDASSAPGEIPAEFRQQITQPPRVTPPPGQPAAAPGVGGVDAFGLHE